MPKFRNFTKQPSDNSLKRRAEVGEKYVSENSQKKIYCEVANTPQYRGSIKYGFIVKLETNFSDKNLAICHNGKQRPGLRCFITKEPEINEFIVITESNKSKSYVLGKVV
jgi:hypothetical protein